MTNKLTSFKEAVKIKSANLRKDFQRSPIREIREMHDTNGKIFKTDTRVLNPENGIYVPFIKATNLLGEELIVNELFKKNAVTILALSMSSLGAEQTKPFVSVGHPIVSVDIITGRLKGLFFNKLAQYYLRKSLPKWRHENAFVKVISKPGLFDSLGAVNRYAGYVYLVDAAGRARWRTSGPPVSESEFELFTKSIEFILRGNDGISSP